MTPLPIVDGKTKQPPHAGANVGAHGLTLRGARL
jgi:hypothetical protein